MTAVTVDTTRIVHGMPDAQYRGAEWVEDVPLTVQVRDGRLVPSPAQVRFFRRRESGGSDA